MKTDKYCIAEFNGKRKVVRLEFAQRKRRKIFGVFESKEEAREAVR